LLNNLAKTKSLRVMLVGFFLFFMVWQPSPAYGAQAWASITCQDSTGNTITRQVGWENENNYFLDKGNIAQHYCEGGFAGQFTTFVSVVSNDGTELDPALLYHPGYIAPGPIGPTPSPEISQSPAPETEQVQRTEDVSRDVERTEDLARPVEPSPEPVPVEPVAPIEPSPEPTPTPTPEPEPTPERPVKPVEPTKPPEVITPTPEPTEAPTSPTEPTIPTEPTPEPTLPEETISIELALEAVGKLVDNLRSIGSDMSPEVREQAQQVVVASVIVTQVALAGRKP
jgi:outer membrane biosynthesis protein TonB